MGESDAVLVWSEADVAERANVNVRHAMRGERANDSVVPWESAMRRGIVRRCVKPRCRVRANVSQCECEIELIAG